VNREVYLDNNATTKVAPEVLQEMLPYFCEYYGNPSSAHNFGANVRKRIDAAREKVAQLIGALPEEIIFTSGGTESDNTAIHSALATQPNKKHIITSKVEHPAVLNYCKYLEKNGYKVSYINVDEDGNIDLPELENSIRQDTAIISIMYANNETGVIFPIKRIAEIAKNHGVLVHTDAVQAVGKIPINLKDMQIDMLSISGHKIHSPKGIGVLYIRKNLKFKPFIIGGHQENGLRAGTENVASIIGLGKACELALKNIDYENTKVRELRDKLECGLVEKIKLTKVNGKNAERLPNTLNISFKNVEGEAILLYLNEKRICASSGSACTTGSLEPSHVLMAMKTPFEYAHGSIRFSFSKYNTIEDVDCVLAEMPAIIEKLRNLSPFQD